MRVLFLVGTLGAGGLERFVTRVALRAKSGNEIEPVVCCLAERKGRFLADLEEAGVEVYAAPKGWARSFTQLKALSQLIRCIAPSVVHSQCDFALLQQFFAIRLAGCSIVCFTERNCYPLHGLARLRRIIQFHLLRAFGAKYTANSIAVAEHLARLVGVTVTSIPVLPNGVPVVEPSIETRARLRAGLGWQENDIGIGYVARMAAHKGHADFLQTIYALRRDGYSIRACLIGDGPQRGKLEQLVKNLGLEGSVTFTGIIANAEDYFQAFDIAVLFSTHEGMPNVILEAMAAGKTIVAAEVGAIPELLDYGKAGIVVHQRTVEDLQKALASIAVDKVKRDHLSEAAFSRAKTLFSIETAYAKLLKHYSEAS